MSKNRTFSPSIVTRALCTEHCNYQTLILQQPVRVGTGSIEKNALVNNTGAFLIEA